MSRFIPFASLAFSLVACSATAPTAGAGTSELTPPTQPGAVQSAPAASATATPAPAPSPDGGGAACGSKVHIEPNDALRVVISGGMPEYCPTRDPHSHAYNVPQTEYRVDLESKLATFSFVDGCPLADGGAPSPSYKSASLTDAQRDAILSATNALEVVVVSQCGADAPDQEVTVRHQGVATSWLVNDYQNTCRVGDYEIAPEGYAALKSLLDGVFK